MGLGLWGLCRGAGFGQRQGGRIAMVGKAIAPMRSQLFGAGPGCDGRHGVRVERVMTDNGSCYKSFAFRDACKALGLKHIRTKPYTPKTNGKAERFIKTALNEWAYARAYQTSDQRAAHLPEWTHSYNWHRPHGGI